MSKLYIILIDLSISIAFFRKNSYNIIKLLKGGYI